MVTLREVADLAGVSVRTVSNVVNNQPHVSPQMKARVQESIERLGYRQNVVARSLRTGRIGLLGLIVPDVRQSLFSQLASAVINEATRLGYTVAIDQTLHDINRERRLIQIGPHGAMFDGAIFHPQLLSEDEIQHRTNDFPLVLVGERLDVDNMDRVYTDDRAAAYDATTQLILDGCRRIAAIGLRREPYAHTAHLREQGFREALTDNGVDLPSHFQQYVLEYDVWNGYSAMDALLALRIRPDAVFCFSDMLALGALRRAQEAGIRIPRDLAIIGFDNIAEDDYSFPSLSSVSADTVETAKSAVSALVNRITKPDSPCSEQTVGHYVVLRESTRNRAKVAGALNGLSLSSS